ncbi:MULTISPECIES: hypothetical protein [unclassified Flavobacterium]|uniref:hypothetical protein n=1 Tax=unclassified Flavobacterium TaxID=196869 RepID=UPI001F147A77|nr:MULTISPECIES: hypothetical protein [unclassified Flavobacterium]UMY66530.1 hypothetical protein MKO97_03865 [Flavobacterium sp. HJ-32-4]
MRLRITEVNYTASHRWLFELEDDLGSKYFIMQSQFYAARGLKDPVTRVMLDSYDRGQWITARTQLIDGINVVVA